MSLMAIGLFCGGLVGFLIGFTFCIWLHAPLRRGPSPASDEAVRTPRP